MSTKDVMYNIMTIANSAVMVYIKLLKRLNPKSSHQKANLFCNFIYRS